MKKFFLLSIFFAAYVCLFAQSQYFNDTNYISQLNKYISPSLNNKDFQNEFKKFSDNWKNNALNDLKFGIIFISNKFYNIKSLPYPIFYYYIQTINYLVQNNKKDFYKEWETAILSILDKPNMSNAIVNQNVSNFLETTIFLLRDSIIYQSASVTWRVKPNNFSISKEIKTDEILFLFNQDIEIYCYYSQNPQIDTLKIKKTQGFYNINRKEFNGKLGRVTWEKFGFQENMHFSKFGSYVIDLKRNKFEFENTEYTNTQLGLSQVAGKITLKLAVSSQNRTSPEFTSYEKLEISKMYKDVLVKGFLKVEGDKIKVVGNEQTDAEMNIFDNNKKVVVIFSKIFELNNKLKKTDTSRIYSPAAKIFMQIEKTTISHNYSMIRYSPTLNKRLYNEQWFKPYNFKYNDGFYLEIQPSSIGNIKLPFEDVTHSFFIYCDRILWRKSDSLAFIVTTEIADKPFVSFQSYNFFNKEEYRYFSGQNTDGINHLEALYNLSKKVYWFSSKDYQKFLFDNYNIQIPTNRVEQIFQELDYARFIQYSRTKDLASITQKTERYLQFYKRLTTGNRKYLDFDNIELISKRSNTDFVKDNAGISGYINFKDNSLTIRYLQPIRLSSSVVIQSDSTKIKNNIFYFNQGIVGAGLSRYTDSSGFYFDYRRFAIEISNAKAEFWTADTVNRNIYLSTISSLLQGINATIFVNDTNNKSNTIKLKEYPKIKSSSQSFIYYDKFFKTHSKDTNIAEFRRNFYFKADNFNFDNLNNINDSNLVLNGTFYSGLFKPLKVRMTVKKDAKGNKMLGFEECTETNQDLRNGLVFKEGKFFGCFGLNDNGLFGNGYILYKSAYCKSSQFVFMPDKVEAKLDSLVINNQTYSPQKPEDIPLIVAENVDMEWSNNMRFTTSKGNILIYSDKNLKQTPILKGTLEYDFNYTYAKGNFKFSDATIISPKKGISLRKNSFETDTCDFVINENNFRTKNLNGKVDINSQLGVFYSNSDTSRIYFPDFNYYCIMDHFLWKIGDGIVNIGGVLPGTDSAQYTTNINEKVKSKNKNIRLLGTTLVNIKDTLTFDASATNYDINNQLIVAENVQVIKVADAQIYPQGNVNIRKAGKIDEFKSISFEFPFNIFSTQKKFNKTFLLHHADVTINNRFSYIAKNAIYSYPYNNQPIVFDLVKTLTDTSNNNTKSNKFSSIYSFGNKKTELKDSIQLNPYFRYRGRGQITITAQSPNLFFTGFSQVDTICNDINEIKNFEITNLAINPDSVAFGVSSRHKSSIGKSVSGIFWSYENQRFNLIPLFTGKYKNEINIDNVQKSYSVFEASGYLTYNKSASEYRLADNPQMLMSNRPDTISGNLLMLNNNFCNIKAQGKFNLFLPWDLDEGKINHVKTSFAGYYRYNIEQDKQVFSGVLTIDFPIPVDILNHLYEVIVENDKNTSVFSSKTIPIIEKNYNVFLGYQKTKKLFEQLNTEYAYTTPPELKHTLVFNDVDLYYSKDSIALISSNRAGLGAINGVPIDVYVKCKIFYSPKGNIPNLYIVFNPSENKYIAFHYLLKDNKSYMKVYISTQSDFDTFIQKMKKHEIQKNYEILDEDFNVIAPFIRELQKN